MDTGIIAASRRQTPAAPDPAVQRAALLAQARDCVAPIAQAASQHDYHGAFPEADLARLREAGLLAAPVPAALGGAGFGTDSGAAADTLTLLRLVGQASLPLGRVFEGHVNAVRLVCRLGSPAQAQQAARDATAGHLFGVWNTDPADTPVRLVGDGRVTGAKILASGAGFVTRALITAEAEPRPLLLARLAPDHPADLAGWTAQGMRASATGRVTFDTLPADCIEPVGAPGAYLAQPDFSGGAWRVIAVQLGGLDALIQAWREMLIARNRLDNPHQLARLGTALIAQETAALFTARAASLAEGYQLDGAMSADAIVAYVGLARIAVETACLDAMRLAQRSIGLAAFMQPAPIERICRDLATYLRQPMPDDTLTEAAAHCAVHGLP